MTARRLHRLAGLVMLLPFLGWAVTGAIFFIKPGYGGAYEPLAVKTYPMASTLALPPHPEWHEVRALRTTLGDHLLVRTESGWRHLDPISLNERPEPTERELRALVSDAFTASPSRYGQIASVANNVVTTSTGVRVTVNWTRLSLSQRGTDTDRIDAIYKVHYLQWTGVAAVDKVLGAVGLLLILVLSALGVRLALGGR